MLTPNTTKTEASKELSNSVAEFLANGGSVTKVKSKKIKVSHKTGPNYCRGRSTVGQNNVYRTGENAFVTDRQK
jgi:hypothetical protein